VFPQTIPHSICPSNVQVAVAFREKIDTTFGHDRWQRTCANRLHGH
jgi:hypothetical protein